MKAVAFIFAVLFAALVAWALTGCGGGGASAPAAPSAAPAAIWQEAPAIEGACCNYASVVFTPSGPRIYTNTAPDNTPGDLNVYENGVGRTVLHVSAPLDAFIRTVAVVEKGGSYFALLETGDAYPGTNGYSPSWATSPGGYAWTWHGPVSPYGRNLSSGGSLTIDDQGRFRAWLDVHGELREMRSDDGLHWTDAGTIPAPGVLFSSAARTPTGTMLSVADAFPSNAIAVLWQCHGGPWKVLETNSAIHFGVKGTALAYSDGLIHAYSNGQHWTASPPQCP